jgi:transcriptional regulator with XRE-family HTH domain
MTGAQIRAARTLLKWTQTELAERARIHRRTIANLETEKHVGNPHTLASLRRAFEAAGITFHNEEILGSDPLEHTPSHTAH